MKQLELCSHLAKSIIDGDKKAWEPLIDAMIELGYEEVCKYHANLKHCINHPRKCSLIVVLTEFNCEDIYNFLDCEESSLRGEAIREFRLEDV